MTNDIEMAMTNDIEVDLRDDPQLLGDQIRKIILVQSKRAGVGHIGSALSVADMVGAVHRVLGNQEASDQDRHRFVMSKGHAALALYAALSLSGSLSDDDLDSYCADGSLLGVHPDHHLAGVDVSTGSLGQGLSVAVGFALAARLAGSERRTIALVSDAECNEGSIWEAAMLASHHRLGNLTVLIDHNHQQAFGYTADVLDSEAMADRWHAFGWNVSDVDGHDELAMATCLANTSASGQPRALVAETTFGSGVSFMERQIKWHYLPMSDDDFAAALECLAHPA